MNQILEFLVCFVMHAFDARIFITLISKPILYLKRKIHLKIENLPKLNNWHYALQNFTTVYTTNYEIIRIICLYLR